MQKISVIVPCYNEQETVDRFYEAATPVLGKLDNMDYEIIFVNDGSRDDTLLRLGRLAEKDKKVKVVSFSRNFGQQAAILCGFRNSTGDCAVELDCDLQDPVDVVPLMVEKWREGFDVVHGRRRTRRGESAFKKLTAKLYYKFLSKICNFGSSENTGDFKLLDRKVVDAVCNMPEHDKYLRGLEAWVGFKQTFVEFDRAERVAGTTHYSLKKMLSLAKAGIVSNSTYPLTLSFKLGAFLSVTSILAFVTFIVLCICKITLPLAAWLFPTVGLISGLSFVMNSFTNLYIAKITEEVKNRPEYIEAERINFDE